MTSGSTQIARATRPATALRWIGRGGSGRVVAIGLGCALFALVPALWLLDAQQRDFATLEQRQRGHAYLAAAAPLASALPWHRDLSTRLLLGEGSVEGALRRAANEMRSAMRRTSAMTLQHGDALALEDDWQDLVARWAHLESRYSRLSAAENVAAHNRLLQHVGQFLALIAQRSQLLQEPSTATRFLLLCESADMPALARHTAMLRAHALLAGLESTPDRRERIAGTLSQANAAFDRLASNLAAAYAADATSRALLEQRSARALDLVREVLQQADALLAPGRAPMPDASAWFSMTTQAVESLQGVHDALSERVERLLAGEAEALRVRRSATQALAVLLGSCALLAALVLGRGLLARQREDTSSAGSSPASESAVDSARPSSDASA